MSCNRSFGFAFSDAHVSIPMIADGVVPSFNMGANGGVPHIDCCEQMCCALACCGAFQQWDMPWTNAQVTWRQSCGLNCER